MNIMMLQEWTLVDEFVVGPNVSPRLASPRAAEADLPVTRGASRWARPSSCASAPTRRDDDAARCGRGRDWGDSKRGLWASARRRHSSPSSRFEPRRQSDRGRQSLPRRHRDGAAQPAGPDVLGARQARRNRRAGERRDGLAKRAARPGRTAGRRRVDDGGRSGRRVNGPRQACGGRLPSRPRSPPRAAAPLDDGVYRPGVDDPRVNLVGGAEEEVDLAGRTGRRTIIRDSKTFSPVFGTPLVWPFLWRPSTAFSASARSLTRPTWRRPWGNTGRIVSEIKQVDPKFADDELLPPGGIAGLTWQERNNLINNLHVARAVAYYRMRGEVGFLQVETLRFLQNAVDAAYEEAVSEADAGRLQPRISRQQAIGDWVDREVRQEFKRMFASYSIPYGPGEDLTINNRAYETLESEPEL